MNFKPVALVILMLALATGGLSACGKRGDPYRPSEVPAPSGESAS